jgi:hypothetical protein
VKRGQEFADLAHRVLTSAHMVRSTARQMGMSYESLYARLRSRTCFSADEIELIGFGEKDSKGRYPRVLRSISAAPEQYQYGDGEDEDERN